MAMIQYTGYRFIASDKPLIIEYDKDRGKEQLSYNDGYDRVPYYRDHHHRDHHHREYRDNYHSGSSGGSSNNNYYSSNSSTRISSSSRGASSKSESSEYSSKNESDDEGLITEEKSSERRSSISKSSPPYSSSSSSSLSSSPSPYYQDRKRIRSDSDHYSSRGPIMTAPYPPNDRYYSNGYDNRGVPLPPGTPYPHYSNSTYHLPIAPSTLPTASAGIPCPTLFVSNLPKDVTERELSILFRFMRGFVGIRLINKEGKLPMCFCDFVDTQSSMVALEFLQGFRMDASDVSSSISIEFDKANHKQLPPPTTNSSSSSSSSSSTLQLSRS